MASVTPIKEAANETAEHQRSDAVKIAEQAWMELMLSGAYVNANKRYAEGYSDARMAKETNLSEEHCARLRERFFGPAGEPKQVEEIRTKINALMSEVNKLKGQFDSMCAKNGYKL